MAALVVLLLLLLLSVDPQLARASGALDAIHAQQTSRRSGLPPAWSSSSATLTPSLSSSSLSGGAATPRMGGSVALPRFSLEELKSAQKVRCNLYHQCTLSRLGWLGKSWWWTLCG